MRDILSDLEAGPIEADPVRRAQKAMQTPLPKRFYESATIEKRDDGWRVLLDGSPVRTPGRTILELPTEAAAAIVAREFEAQETVIDPSTMPATRLANTVVDGVATDPQAVLEDILRFVGSDLVFYRAADPERLVALQAEAWDPVLDWARSALGARFFLAEGVMHVAQPRESVSAVGLHLRQRDEPFRLACLHLMTTLTGSALISLAIEAGAIGAEEGWAAAHVDEDWQLAQWGEDEEAARRRAFRKRDMMAAVALLDALDGGSRVG